MAEGAYQGVYVVGAGQTPYEKRTTKTLHRLFWEAGERALADAGLAWRQVDGLAVTAFALHPDNVTTVAEHFGLECRWLFQGLFGGASEVIGMLHAARAIQAGDADVVLCVAGDSFDVESHMQIGRNAGQRDYMGPWGYGAANGIFALHTRLYMETYGVTREDFGRLCVAQRRNANINPNALFHDKTLSLEDYMAGRVIAAPIHLFDCVHPCCGGDAIVLASERAARDLKGPKVRILGGGEVHNAHGDDIFALQAGFERFQERMYAQAGCGPRDMDFVQLYDDYPVMAFIQLEGLGFCARGEAARLVRETDTTVNGALPINTGGGQLSAGQAGWSGGMIGLVEAVLQLRGAAGARQVACERGLVSGYGMVAYGRGLSASAAVLARDRGRTR